MRCRERGHRAANKGLVMTDMLKYSGQRSLVVLEAEGRNDEVDEIWV